MKNVPWLTIIGMDSGGFENLSTSARVALKEATTIIGPQRHLSMLPELSAERLIWPKPFSIGIDMVLRMRHTPVAMLVSGHPFWFGAGTKIIKHLDRGEWNAIPAQSCFTLAASILGWPMEMTVFLSLHAAPFSRLRPYLSPAARILTTVRDGSSLPELAEYISQTGFGESRITALESLGSREQKITNFLAKDKLSRSFQYPLMAGIEVAGGGKVMPLSNGLPDDWFDHDGQLTKQPIRALTLSALSSRTGQHLWDLGAGSGSISIEWLLSGSHMRATAVERNLKRTEIIKQNAERLGVDWLNIVQAENLDAIETLQPPDTVFIGGGLNQELLARLWKVVPAGTRFVANAVTVETDRALTQIQQLFGGTVCRFEISQLQPIGQMHGWKASYPITQWIATN